MPGSGVGTFLKMLMTLPSFIQRKSRGKRMSFIQKFCLPGTGKTNSMPSRSRESRPDRPRTISAEVVATSTSSSWPLMVIPATRRVGRDEIGD